MSERLALCETFGLVVLPDAGELAFLDCVNGAADRGEGCPVLARRRRRLDDPATTAPHGAHGVVAAPRCTAAESCTPSTLGGRVLIAVLAAPDLGPREGLANPTNHRPRLLRRFRMKFRPLHDRVVVRRLEAEEKTAGGIIIPDTAKEKPMEGEVIAVGPGARDEAGKLVPLDVKANDRILFGKWSGTEVKLDGEELLIMKESDIMGIIEGQPAAKRKAA